MTTEDLKSFLVENNIQPGDKVRILYSFGFPPSWMNKEIVSSSLVKGCCTIKTKSGPLSLPEDEEYLIVFSKNTGATSGLTAKYIDQIEFDGYGPMTPLKFSSIIKQNEIIAGDRISFVMIDNQMLSGFKLLKTELFIDENKEFLIWVELPNGISEYMYLNTISEIFCYK